MQELGFHYRITDIQCALALSQFKKLEAFINRRREIVERYDLLFSNLQYCRPAQTSGRAESGHHLYVLRIDFEKIGKNRKQLMEALRKRDIGSQVHYIPVPAHPYYRMLGFLPEEFPNSQKYYQEALSIPVFYDLTEQQQNHVISAIKELVG